MSDKPPAENTPKTPANREKQPRQEEPKIDYLHPDGYNHELALDKRDKRKKRDDTTPDRKR